MNYEGNHSFYRFQCEVYFIVSPREKGPEGFNHKLLIRTETVRSGTGSFELQPGNLIHLKPMKVD